MKFAIIRRNGLGDFISATVPLYNYIKKYYPDSEVHLFLSQLNFPLAKFFLKDRGRDYVHLIEGGRNKYLSTISTAIKYRKLNIDVGLSPAPLYNKLNGLFLSFLGARQKLGFVSSEKCEKLLFSTLIEQRCNVHIALLNLSLLNKNIECLDEDLYPKINKDLVLERQIGLSGIKVIIEVSNNRESCQLTNENLAHILNCLYEYKEFSVIISSKLCDAKKANALSNMLKMHTLVVTSKTLDEFVSLVDQADVFLFGDGGAGHIAGALGKPGVSLFSNLNAYVRWAVLSGRVVQLYDKSNVNNIDLKCIASSLLSCLSRCGY